MIRRHVLAALAVGIDAASDDAARGALGAIDWVLRGGARKRLEDVLLEAAIATGIKDYEDPVAIVHWLRAAALILRDQRDGLGDPDRVASAYRAMEQPAPLRWPIATAIAATVAFATATAFAAVTVMAIQGPPDVSYHRPDPPPPVGVFRDGGVPRHDPAIEAVLATEFPQLVAMSAIARTGPVGDGARVAKLTELRENPAFAAHGPQLATAWTVMLATFDRWMLLYPGDRAWAETSRELRARVDVVSDQLAAIELGYYLDPEIVREPHPRRRAGVFSYRIEQISFVRANDTDRIRVLGARRLDPHDAGAALLGMKQEELDDPIVLLDTVESKVTTQILPVLAGARFPIGSDTWSSSTYGRLVADAAGAAIRRELLAALYTDAQSVERATIKTRELIATSVGHHEAQHKLDHDRDLAYPAALSARLGDKRNDPFAVRSRYELSAYVSQIASDTWMPQLTLWNLARHGFRKGTRREETFVAVVVIEGLARRLGIPPVGQIITNGEVNRDRLAALALPLASRTTVELRSAAALLWADLFGEKLVRLYD